MVGVSKGMNFHYGINEMIYRIGDLIMAETKITKDMLIGELLAVKPDCAEILMEAGMHCVGCPASQMESIEEASMVHGFDVNEILEKLNA